MSRKMNRTTMRNSDDGCHRRHKSHRLFRSHVEYFNVISVLVDSKDSTQTTGGRSTMQAERSKIL